MGATRRPALSFRDSVALHFIGMAEISVMKTALIVNQTQTIHAQLVL